MQEDPRSPFERHVQTAIALLLVALVLWVGTTVTGNREEIVRVQERIDVFANRQADHERRIRKLENNNAAYGSPYR